VTSTQNLGGNAAYIFFTTDFCLHGVLQSDICGKTLTLGSTAALYFSSLQKNFVSQVGSLKGLNLRKEKKYN
jgi:hypothetical protein